MAKLVITLMIFFGIFAQAQVVIDPKLAPLEFQKMEKAAAADAEAPGYTAYDGSRGFEVTTFIRTKAVGGQIIKCSKQVKTSDNELLGYGCESVPDPCFNNNLCD